MTVQPATFRDLAVRMQLRDLDASRNLRAAELRELEIEAGLAAGRAAEPGASQVARDHAHRVAAEVRVLRRELGASPA